MGCDEQRVEIRRAGQLEPLDLAALTLNPVSLNDALGESDLYAGGGRRHLRLSGGWVTRVVVHLGPFHAVGCEGPSPPAGLSHERGGTPPSPFLWCDGCSIVETPTMKGALLRVKALGLSRTYIIFNI